RVGLLFRRTTTGDVKVSFRSNGEVDVNVLARRFDGGGHVKASGAVLSGPMDEALERVLAATRDAGETAVGQEVVTRAVRGCPRPFLAHSCGSATCSGWPRSTACGSSRRSARAGGNRDSSPSVHSLTMSRTVAAW